MKETLSKNVKTSNIRRKNALSKNEIANLYELRGTQWMPMIQEIFDCCIKIQKNSYNLNLTEEETELIQYIRNWKKFQKRKKDRLLISSVHGMICRKILENKPNTSKEKRRNKANIVIAKMLSLKHMKFSDVIVLDGSKCFYDIAVI